MSTALITGISGQDGSYLAEQLLADGVEVVGIVRRHSVAEHQDARLAGMLHRIRTVYGDVTDYGSLLAAVGDCKPDEVYHLAAQSHVRVSFDVPRYTIETNAIGTFNLLEAVRHAAPSARVYFAGSSEMFGLAVDEDGYQRETTPMVPVSPYGISKVFGYNMARHYRRAYKMHVSCGILFNHESPRRGANFVTAKVAKAAAEAKLGLIGKVALGNLDAMRDWGYAPDYVRAMRLMVRAKGPDDWVIATGKRHSVRDLCKIAFGVVGLDWGEYVEVSPRYFRAEELPYLRGDASKARRELGWEPTVSFEEMVEQMVQVHTGWRDE